jgi:hypothetical protein
MTTLKEQYLEVDKLLDESLETQQSLLGSVHGDEGDADSKELSSRREEVRALIRDTRDLMEQRDALQKKIIEAYTSDQYIILYSEDLPDLNHFENQISYGFPCGLVHDLDEAVGYVHRQAEAFTSSALPSYQEKYLDGGEVKFVLIMPNLRTGKNIGFVIVRWDMGKTV